MDLIELKNIYYTYSDNTKALNGIDINIEEGKKVAVLGENGSGKSTLFLILNGIYNPSQGDYFYRGKKVGKNGYKELAKDVGLVFQDPDVQLFAPTVFHEISFGLKNIGLKDSDIKDKVMETMEEFKITDLQDKPVHNLSYGQKKLVSIASVFAMGCRLFIFDEPTTWLDFRHRETMLEIVDKIHKFNKTIIISTHDTELAYQWSDEIIVLKKGRVVLAGAPEEVFKNENFLEKLGIEIPLFVKISKRLGLDKLPGSKEELLAMMENEKCKLS